MANVFGRQVVLPFTNKSGGQVIAGDVVILDSTNNDSFTTSTAGAVTTPIGIAQETIASNAVGRVLVSGYAALINVNASVTRGNYGKTHTVAKQATDAGAARVAGTFVWFSTGGATPTGYVYPVDLAGAALTNPMTTVGDTIVGGASGTPTRLAALVAGTATRTSGDLTTTSTTFVDLTGMSVTITTGAHRCLVNFIGTATNSTTSNTAVDLNIDGSLQGQTYGLALKQGPIGTNSPLNFSFVTAVLSAASHTFKIQWRVDGGTGTMFASTTVSPAIIQVIETGLTT